MIEAILLKKTVAKKFNTPVRQAEKDKKQFLTRDAVWFKGRPRELAIFTDTSPKVSLANNDQICLYMKQKNNAASFEKKKISWLRKELMQEIRDLVKIWEPVTGVSVQEACVKKMKTRWGSCNINARRIWLNFMLIHLPSAFLEYVVVHEMVHLLERRHNERFRRYLDQFIPEWSKIKKEMNQYVLY